MAYDPTTDAGKVRLLIADTADPPDQIFTDAEITAFLDMAGDSIQRAAASGLRSIAASRARLSKRLKVLDVEVDRKQAVRDLLDAAKAIEEAADEDGAFAFAEMVPNNVYAIEERLVKDAQRDEA